MTLTASSSFVRRYWAWMGERFPLTPTLLFFVLYVAVLLYGRMLVEPDGPLKLDWRDIFGFAAVYGFFLMLRVFDEHKDFQSDSKNFPERVLQRGLITLTHLKIAGAVAIAAQVAVAIAFDEGVGMVSLRWLCVLAWSLLMLREFFVGEWLNKHLLLYAISHMFVMPLAELWMAQMGAGQRELPWEVLWVSALSFTSGLSFEIARKMRAPQDERDGVDTYTKRLGTIGAPIAVWVCLAVSAGIQLMVVDYVFAGATPSAAVAFLAAYVVITGAVLAGFALRPTPFRAKLSEGITSIAMLIGYSVVFVAIITARGLEFVG